MEIQFWTLEGLKIHSFGPLKVWRFTVFCLWGCEDSQFSIFEGVGFHSFGPLKVSRFPVLYLWGYEDSQLWTFEGVKIHNFEHIDWGFVHFDLQF